MKRVLHLVSNKVHIEIYSTSFDSSFFLTGKTAGLGAKCISEDEFDLLATEKSPPIIPRLIRVAGTSRPIAREESVIGSGVQNRVKRRAFSPPFASAYDSDRDPYTTVSIVIFDVI